MKSLVKTTALLTAMAISGGNINQICSDYRNQSDRGRDRDGGWINGGGGNWVIRRGDGWNDSWINRR